MYSLCYHIYNICTKIHAHSYKFKKTIKSRLILAHFKNLTNESLNAQTESYLLSVTGENIT